ncbi:MAG TPA: insulinase family protein [bacterium]|nr:insulinase family protein [bacterium]
MKNAGLKSFVLKAAFVCGLILIQRGNIMADYTGEVYREVLNNGITVIIRENRAAPVAAVNFWIRVGAAFESDNEKGMSHFIEHMMFKGTKTRGLGVIDREIKALGGYNNAFTSYDATNYIIVLPSEHVKKAIEIQFDALVNSFFDPAEVEKEREVILAELYRGLDNPRTFLSQKIMSLGFESRYSDPIIGFAGKLKGYTREELLDFYSKYYLAKNIVITVSGDVDAAETAAHIRETASVMKGKSNNEISASGAPEKPRGFRYKAYSGAIDGRYSGVMFNILDALSADIPALEVLARILGGTESSVLNRVVKEELELVDDISADIFSGRFGGAFFISATVRENKFGDVVEAVFTEVEKIREYGISAGELNKAKADIARELARENMKVESAAMNLGYYEVLTGYEFYDVYLDRLQRVTTRDIQAAAEKYLYADNAAMAVYYPEKSAKEFAKFSEAKAVYSLAAREKQEAVSGHGTAEKRRLSNGMTLIHKEMVNSDILSIRVLVGGGVIYEGGLQAGAYKGITNLMLETMMKGTRNLSAAQFAAEIDRIGAVLNTNTGKESFGWSAEVMPENLENFIGLFAEMVRYPAFSLGEIRKEKNNITNRVARVKDNPALFASKIFYEEFFEWHPYGFFTPGSRESINRIPSRELKSWHSTYVNPANIIVSTAGNAGIERVAAALEESFGGWKGGREMKPSLPVRITRAKKEIREEIDKNQSHIVIGFTAPKVNSDEYYAFRVLDAVLSGGMDSRLFSRIRDELNLCYSIYSTFDRFMENGSFRIHTATSPENEDKAASEILKLLSELVDKGVTDGEVEAAKNYINGMFKIGSQDYGAQADSYALYEFWGMGYKEVDSFTDNIFRVTTKDVNEAARRYINLGRYTMAVAGPKKKGAAK